MRRNYFFKFIAMVLVLTMFFSVTAYAATPQVGIMPLSSGESGDISESFTIRHTDDLETLQLIWSTV